jgi:phosphatidate cytidylyltransferase
MLRTRLWMGAALIVLAATLLVLDQPTRPYFPFLLILAGSLATLSCLELTQLLASSSGPRLWFCLLGVLAVVLANWPAYVIPGASTDPWHWVLGAFTAVVLLAFLVEMACFREPGGAVSRIALAVWTVAYLGLLPSFLFQLRFLPGDAGSSGVPRGLAALALGIFTPKVCDIGAFFTGRLLGRHPMTPLLSPKKTWEGFMGGLGLAALVAVGLNRLMPVVPGGDLGAAGFGVTVGLAGVLGDLAESLIKRDCRQKDASQVVPGFGGVLDVIDSILFAAPVAWCWLR